LALAGKSIMHRAGQYISPAPGRARAFRNAFLLLALAAAALSACKSTVGTKAQYAADAPAGVLYNKGLAYMNNGKLKDAVKNFDEVDRQHPYSEEARKALIMSAFASYRRGQYEATITTTQRYLTLFPGTSDAAYAQYMMAQSYFSQIPDVTRDQSKTQKALDAMQEIVTKYPDSEYVDDARKKILITRDQLAGKEMQIGRYYLERREYVAAINRFKTVTTQYQDTRHVEEALERMVEANLAMGLVGEAQTDAALLGHNFPDSRWYKDAYTLLKKKGVEPVDNGGAVTAAVAKKTG
jgi:outer membrane protein assembly factor BamD